LHALGLVQAIRGAIADGKPYTGWSAGSNVACPTLCTTNDMPIIRPPTFEAIGAIPFQINPHYLDAHPDRHMGETRAERIEEFLKVNPEVRVVGLREGSAVRVEGAQVSLLGTKSARIFEASARPFEVEAGGSLDFLLT
jgi:dipeptidase E